MTKESRFFLLLITVLIAVGCSSDNAIQIRFNAEKLYHRADKLFEKASIKMNKPGPRLNGLI